MKKSCQNTIIFFLLLLSFTVKAQTSITKNAPFTEKTLKMAEPVSVRYETETPAVYSNPTNQTQIAFENRSRETVNLYLLTAESKEVQVLYTKSKTGTREIFTIYTSQLANGTYICKIEAGSNVVTRKLIVSK